MNPQHLSMVNHKGIAIYPLGPVFWLTGRTVELHSSQSKSAPADSMYLVTVWHWSLPDESSVLY